QVEQVELDPAEKTRLQQVLDGRIRDARQDLTTLETEQREQRRAAQHTAAAETKEQEGIARREAAYDRALAAVNAAQGADEDAQSFRQGNVLYTKLNRTQETL